MFEKKILTSMVIAAVAVTALAADRGVDAAGSDYRQAIRSEVVPDVKAWANSPSVINAINEQNRRHATLTSDQIERLDRAWREETKTASGPTIDGVLGNDLSSYLRKVQRDAQGLYTEIFVMDNKGLNVGQSNLTSDYWQGDEAKWQKTYLAGADSMLIDEVEFDESTQTFQSQLSLPVIDPATDQVIGAVTVGVNVELFQ